MKNKEEVYVVVDSRKKAIELEEVLKMFGELTFNHDSIDQCLRSDGFLVFSEYYGSWFASSSGENRIQVSIQELKNILAAEYLKPGDEVVLGIGDIERNAIFIGMKDLNFEAQYYFDGDIYLNPSIETICFHDFKRYQNKIDDDVAIVERLHDTLHENHGYSLDSELLTKARKLAIKLRKSH